LLWYFSRLASDHPRTLWHHLPWRKLPHGLSLAREA
jgi:hypothetical protein